jgi:hypothetical protein
MSERSDKVGKSPSPNGRVMSTDTEFPLSANVNSRLSSGKLVGTKCYHGAKLFLKELQLNVYHK